MTFQVFGFDSFKALGLDAIWLNGGDGGAILSFSAEYGIQVQRKGVAIWFDIVIFPVGLNEVGK